MRITNVEVYCLGFERTVPSRASRSWAITKVSTDKTVIGWGESSDCYGHSIPTAIKEIVEDEIRRIVIGRDPTTIRSLSPEVKRYLYRNSNQKGLVAHAFAGFEIACWDILGKVERTSVAQLLGQRRERIPIYAGGTLTFQQAPGWFGPFFDDLLGRGVRGVKVRIGNEFTWDVEVVRATRDYIGPDRELLVDAKYNYTTASALRLLKAIEPSRPYLLEEPLPPHNLTGMGRLVASSSIPIAYGESLTSVHDFKLLLDQRAATVLEPDATVAAGFLECLDIGALAAAHSVPICLHSGGLTPIGIAANLHLAAALPSIGLHEYDAAPEQPLRDQLATCRLFSPEEIQDGYLAVPDGPGLGIEIDESVLERYRYRKRTTSWEFGDYGSPRV
ncbi:MAG: mandelate racemase/muconate lactonizing enzyme family protein [Planctomycetes bacterium]|nr:mandelate racemase/muconate lactonizing enzyme family protein [Planctomycetota bacterium]